MENTQSSSNGMTRHMRMLAIVLVPVVALILGAAAPELWADGDGDELEFEEAWFNIEFNSTDEDLGVRGFVDGDPWKEVEIEDPNGRTIANIWAKKSLADQGFAELFFESGEPTLEDVPIATFLGRFPEGTYEFEGETIEGDDVEGEAEFTWIIPCGPEIWADVKPRKIVIKWNAVETVVNLNSTTYDPEECYGSDDLLIVGYRVEVEWEEVLNEGTPDEEEIVHKFGIDLEADQYQVTVPPEFMEIGQEFQYEVLAIEVSGNQTITEREWPEED